MGAKNKVYLAVANTETKVVIVRQSTTENKKFLKTKMGDGCVAFKVRAVSTQEVFEKIKKQTGIDDLTLDVSRHYDLPEIEEIDF